MTYHLYVSRGFDGDFDLDAKIEKIVGAERIGSGAGFGTRDIDFKVDATMNQAQVMALKQRIDTECGVCAEVLYEEWSDDESDDGDGPLVALSA